MDIKEAIKNFEIELKCREVDESFGMCSNYECREGEGGCPYYLSYEALTESLKVIVDWFQYRWNVDRTRGEDGQTMLTLEEAIIHAEDTAMSAIGCECRYEHRQLAEWLRELVERRKKDIIDMPSVLNNQVNLCDSCTYTYPECPSEKDDVIFGNGIGNDNICACNKYQPTIQPEGRSRRERKP